MKDRRLSHLFCRFRDRRDGRALARVFDATARELIDVAKHLVATPQEAEDLVQTTFRVAIERASTFHDDRSVTAWLYGILAREAAKERRRAARRVDREELERRAAPEPIDGLIEAEAPVVLRRAVERLHEPYRQVVELALFTDRTIGDIARDLGRAPGTVRVQLQRGLERVRRLLPTDYRSASVSLVVPLRGMASIRAGVLEHAGATAWSASPWIAIPSTWCLGAVLLVASAWGVHTRATAQASTSELPTTLVRADLSPVAIPSTPECVGEVEATRRPQALPASRHPDDPQVTGIVIDEDDSPIEGVVVRGKQDDDSDFRVRFRTGADGRFSFADLDPGYWHFSVDDARFATVWWRRYSVRVDRPGETVRMRLFAPRTTDGLVVDENERPVAGVRVRLAREWIAGEMRPVQGQLVATMQEATTDADGRFRFDRLSPGRLTAVLDHPDHARSLADFAAGAQDARLVIRRGATLRGRVVAESGALENVKVLAMASCRSSLSMGDRSAITGPNGEFEIERIHSFHDISSSTSFATVTVAIEDEDWSSRPYRIYEAEPNVLPRVLVEAVPAGSSLDTEPVHVGRDAADTARGEPPGTGTVRVMFDEPSVVGARPQRRVWLQGLENGELELERGSPGQGVEFERIHPGRYRVWTHNEVRPNLVPREIEVGEGEVVHVHLRTGPIELKGQIRCGDDAVTGVAVLAKGPMRGRGIVGDDGRYEIAGLVPGEYEVAVRGPGSFENYTLVEIDDTGDSLRRADIELPGGVIDGVVRGAAFGSGGAREVLVYRRGWGTASGNRGVGLAVDTEGRFRVKYVPPGDYIVWRTMHPRVRYACARVTPDDPVQSVVLQPPARVVTVTGVITNPIASNDELGWTSLNLVPKDELGYSFGGSSIGGSCEADGTFRIPHVEPGRYGLHVSHQRIDGPHVWISDVVVPDAGLEGLEVTLPESRAVRVRMDTNGREARLRIWYLHMPDGARIPYATFVGSEPSGRVASAAPFHLPLGEYTIEGLFDDDPPLVRTFVLEPGDREFVVTLRRER